MKATPHMFAGFVTALAVTQPLTQEGEWVAAGVLTAIGGFSALVTDGEFANSPAGRLVPLKAAHDGYQNGRQIWPLFWKGDAQLAIWHRGPSHSILAAVLWAIVVGTLALLITDSWLWSEQAATVALLAYLSHLFLDLFSASGQWLFCPLGPERWRWPIPPVSGKFFQGCWSVGLAMFWGTAFLGSPKGGGVVVVLLFTYWALLAFWRWQ